MSEQEYRYIVRLADRDIDGQENLLQGFTRVSGVGLRLSKTILTKLGLDPFSRLGYLPDEDIARIEEVLKDPIAGGLPQWYVNRPRDRLSGRYLHLTGADLQFAHRNDIDRLMCLKNSFNRPCVSRERAKVLMRDNRGPLVLEYMQSAIEKIVPKETEPKTAIPLAEAKRGRSKPKRRR